MLAHFENIYLPPLLINFDRFHISFSHNLDSNLLSTFIVCTKAYFSELPLAKNIPKLVVIGNTRRSNLFSQNLSPLQLFRLRYEVKHSRFSGWNDDFQRPERFKLQIGVIVYNSFQLLHISSHKCMHNNLCDSLRIFVTVKLVSNNYHPMHS